MRRGGLLTISLLAVLSAGCPGSARRPVKSDAGLISLQPAGDGATLVLSGVLTRESFKLKSMHVEGSRLAGKGSDPDQFRATLLGASGQELEVVKMWSPLLRFEWDPEGQHESARTLDKHSVEISIPASTLLDQVVLSWADGKEVAHVKVGPEIRRFCKRSPQNAACKSDTSR